MNDLVIEEALEKLRRKPQPRKQLRIELPMPRNTGETKAEPESDNRGVIEIDLWG